MSEDVLLPPGTRVRYDGLEEGGEYGIVVHRVVQQRDRRTRLLRCVLRQSVSYRRAGPETLCSSIRVRIPRGGAGSAGLTANGDSALN